MNFFAEIALYTWPVITITLFFSLKPHHAALVCVLGGWLFLPTGVPPGLINIPGLPDYTKSTAIALGLILGGRISGHRQEAFFSFGYYDLPMILWCFCPMFSSLSSQLGIYDGLSGSFNQIILWGIPYFTGRIYFSSKEALRDLCLAIIIGGILYGFLCLFEVRMSPKLHRLIYGFFPHSFSQHIRYGGYRPIVFMQHGLMVSFWMAISSTVLFWLWRYGVIKHIIGMPISFFVAGLTITTVLCKSVNGWFAMLVGYGGYFLYCFKGKSWPFRLLILIVPFYIAIRLMNFVPAADIAATVSWAINPKRVASLEARLYQENLFSQKIIKRPFFGWSGFNRGRPIDPRTGEILDSVDSLWLISASKHGLVGLIAFLSSMLIGPWKILQLRFHAAGKKNPYRLDSVLLSLVVTLFMMDSLFNGMLNPVYVLISGALISQYLIIRIADLAKN